jgi:uncharacterized protein with HEPN domain
MLDCIQAIEHFTQGLSMEDLQKSRLHQDAIVRNLEVIGEAANQLPKSIHQLDAGIPWPQLISLRNRLIHEYHGVNWDILIPAIIEQLPELKTRLTHLSKKLPQGPLDT